MFVVVMIKFGSKSRANHIVSKARCDRCVTSDNFWSFLSNSISKLKANSKSQSITMVVTHSTTSSPAGRDLPNNPEEKPSKNHSQEPRRLPI